MTLRLLAISLLCLSLTGCARRPADDGKVHLVFAAPSSRDTRPFYQAQLAKFHETHPGIAVRFLEIPKDYYRKVLVMIAGRCAPDLMWMGQSFGEFATRGAFLDISRQVEAEVDLDQYLTQVVDWYRIEGKLLGIPFGVDMEFVAYNKALFDEAGVDYPTDDWHADDLLAKAKLLTLDRDGDGRLDQYGYRGSIDPSAFGARILSADGKRALCSSPEMVQCLQYNLDLVHKWKVSPLPDAIEQEGIDKYAAFRAGRAAMMKMFTWDLPALGEQCANVDWDLVNAPRVKQRGHWASSQAVLISADTKHPKEAWELCKAFFGDDFQRTMAARGLPTNLRIARQVFAGHKGKPANIAALLKATDSLYPFPRVPHLQELMQHYWNGTESVNSLRATPEEAMAAAAKAINRTIARRR